MNRSAIVHSCLLVAAICFTALVWMSVGKETELTPEELQLAIDEGRAQENLSGEYEIIGEEKGSLAGGAGMILKIFLLVVVAGYAAILFIAYLLPEVVSRITHMFYDSGEQLEEDPMHDARALVAQGDYDGAVEAYREVAAEQPENRFPWVEIARIQRENLENADASINTLRLALESQEWRVNDATFMMFRLAELYEDDKADLETAIDILKQVAEMFPETRHAANATHRLRELGAI